MFVITQSVENLLLDILKICLTMLVLEGAYTVSCVRKDYTIAILSNLSIFEGIKTARKVERLVIVSFFLILLQLINFTTAIGARIWPIVLSEIGTMSYYGVANLTEPMQLSYNTIDEGLSKLFALTAPFVDNVLVIYEKQPILFKNESIQDFGKSLGLQPYLYDVKQGGIYVQYYQSSQNTYVNITMGSNIEYHNVTGTGYYIGTTIMPSGLRFSSSDYDGSTPMWSQILSMINVAGEAAESLQAYSSYDGIFDNNGNLHVIRTQLYTDINMFNAKITPRVYDSDICNFTALTNNYTMQEGIVTNITTRLDKQAEQILCFSQNIYGIYAFMVAHLTVEAYLTDIVHPLASAWNGPSNTFIYGQPLNQSKGYVPINIQNKYYAGNARDTIYSKLGYNLFDSNIANVIGDLLLLNSSSAGGLAFSANFTNRAPIVQEPVSLIIAVCVAVALAIGSKILNAMTLIGQYSRSLYDILSSQSPMNYGACTGGSASIIKIMSNSKGKHVELVIDGYVVSANRESDQLPLLDIQGKKGPTNIDHNK